ncbi:MAG: DNA mismatch repair endonuclease MutL [Cyanobacteria bacterium RI_101]|nr:DNA mismatch repair endonuclease MutL [Cyanobacteria bacterium RI_101]
MIHSLPLDLARRIAAGEVIDSWRAAARELTENALDAGADRIIIRFWPDLWQIQVLDNGAGMALEDLERCALPCATSKIQVWEDLAQAQTLGFRGEALHSLAQLGNLTIQSRPEDQPEGWRLDYDGQGRPQRREMLASAPGTLVTVRELFAALPQRREALQSSGSATKAIQSYVEMMALAHPQVAWQFWLERPTGSKLIGQISPAAGADRILLQILKRLQPGDLLLRESQPAPASRLTLLLGLPDRCHRHRPDWVRVILNGRPVHCPELEQVLLGAFQRALPQGRFPLCVASLSLPPDQVDFNRHPAKTEVYLAALPQWRELLQRELGMALGDCPPRIGAPARLQTLLKTAESSQVYEPNPLTASLSSLLQPRGLRVVGQINQTYILVEEENGLLLVEQHVAQERVLFEALEDDWPVVSLPQPLLVSGLTPAQVERLMEFPLEIEPFGENLWALRTAPAPLLAMENPEAVLAELSLCGSLSQAQATLACRAAIKNGTLLTQKEMEELIGAWQKTRQPHTCPHGRPIYLELKESSLARFFRRSWIVGKD